MRSTRRLKTIVWDVDDVLNDLMYLWLEKGWKEAHPECTVRYEDLKENPPHGILGIGFEEYTTSLDRYRTQGPYLDLNPVVQVKDWFVNGGGIHRHIALTSVPLHAAHVSAQWVYRHFGTWIRTFHVVPAPRGCRPAPNYDGDKTDFLKWLGKVDMFIDDTQKNVDGAKAAGIHAVLMPRPWNRSRETIPEILERISLL